MEKVISMKINRSVTLLRAEFWISFVLRYGVLLCATIISVGLGLKLFSSSGQLVQGLTSGLILQDNAVPRTVGEYRVGLGSANPDVVISLGLWFLISLPVLRVGMTVVLFVLERDWIYLGISLFVFVVLLSSILCGTAHSTGG
jgi:uncharacterized membrane protein